MFQLVLLVITFLVLIWNQHDIRPNICFFTIIKKFRTNLQSIITFLNFLKIFLLPRIITFFLRWNRIRTIIIVILKSSVYNQNINRLTSFHSTSSLRTNNTNLFFNKSNFLKQPQFSMTIELSDHLTYFTDCFQIFRC